MITVGLCEDDDEIRQIVTTTLEEDGCKVRATASGADAVEVFSSCDADVLVLDIGLPDADGRDVCQALRARGVLAPVMFLTARVALADVLSGFDAGGDDYMTKPFAPSELAVRVRALARRGAPRDLSESGTAGLLNPARHAISGEVEVALTPTEYRLLAAACAATGGAVRRGELVAAGWPDGSSVADSTLDAFVSRIRDKLRRAGRPETLSTVRGVGYRLA